MVLINYVNFIEKLEENSLIFLILSITYSLCNSIRKNHAVNNGIDYEAYKTNQMLFIISICMIIAIVTYRLITNKKES